MTGIILSVTSYLKGLNCMLFLCMCFDWFKVNTAIQLSVVAFTLAAPVFGYVDHPAIQALW